MTTHTSTLMCEQCDRLKTECVCPSEIPDVALPSERVQIAERILIGEFMNAYSNVETLILMRKRARELGVDCGPRIHRQEEGFDRRKQWVQQVGGGPHDGYWRIVKIPRKTLTVDWENVVVCLPQQTDPLWDKLEKGESLDV